MAGELNFVSGITGQTVTATLFQGGTAVTGAIGFSIDEDSGEGGFYTGNMPSVAAGIYVVVFYVGGIARGGGRIGWDGSLEAPLEILTQQLKNYLTGVLAVVTGPVAGSPGELTVTITVGDDYYHADNRSADFTLDGAELPDLTGASCDLICAFPNRQLAIPGSIVTPTGSTRLIRFEPTSTETLALGPAVFGPVIGIFWVRITTASGHTISPGDAAGQLIVLPGKSASEISD